MNDNGYDASTKQQVAISQFSKLELSIPRATERQMGFKRGKFLFLSARPTYLGR